MIITKKLDRAFQWAGEKMGQEAKTSLSQDFLDLQTEMALRTEGMIKQQAAMNAYIKWLTRRVDSSEDKEKGLPASFLGRSMISYGENFEEDSEFGNCLIAAGRANESLALQQEHFAADATSVWLDSVERSVAMMKEYNLAKKKLESRRLALDASSTKLQKARRDDFRIEEEVRSARAKYEESSEDVLRRMQDIKEAEADSTRDLRQFVETDLEYHERCVEELRRVRDSMGGAMASRTPNRSRSNTARSHASRLSLSRTMSESRIDEYEDQSTPLPSRIGANRPPSRGQASLPSRPSIPRANTYQGTSPTTRDTPSSTGRFPAQHTAISNLSSARGNLRPLSRMTSTPDRRQDVFADDDTAGSEDESSLERSSSPATSYGSGGVLSRTTSQGVAGKKGPPPPPPSRSTKPAPPVPTRRF